FSAAGAVTLRKSAETISGVEIAVTRSRGNVGTPTQVYADDELFVFQSYYHNGAGFVDAGKFGVKMATDTTGEFYSALNFHMNDNLALVLGTGRDALIDYDSGNNSLDIDLATNGVNTGLRILTDNGRVFITNLKLGATQVGAGAAANELWKTASHATLPDNVVLIGV
ncbi:hypothetical protein KJ708_10160, partial [bacterium]|nr:hypothetical protein [bacterium]